MNRILIGIGLLVGISLSSSSLLAQALPRLESAVRTLDQDPDMRSANWGICVLEARTGKILLSHNHHRNMVTASTMKAISTATAMRVLGSEFRFQTRLQYDGKLENGVPLW